MRFRAKGADSFLSAFAQQPHLPWPFQLKITGAYRQSFADARSRVIEKQQQGVIAFPITTPTINGGDHRTGLFRFQISGGPS